MPNNINIKQYPLPELLNFYESVESIECKWKHAEENTVYNTDGSVQANAGNSVTSIKNKIMQENQSVQDNDNASGSSEVLDPATSALEESHILSIDIEEIKRIAFEEGVQTAKAQHDTAEVALRESAIHALTSIATQLQNIDKQLKDELQEILHGCVELAMAIAQKIIGVSISTKAADMVIDFLKKNLPLLYTEPLIEIKINELDFEQVEQYIQGCIKECGLTNIRLISSLNINQANCIIDFKSGTIVKDRVTMLEELGIILANYLGSK